MRRIVCLFVACCLSLSCFAKSDGFKGKINSVQKQSGENVRGIDTGILKINTIQSGKIFDSLIRISMQMVGKNGQIAWGTSERVNQTDVVRGGEHEGMKPTGAISWTGKGYNAALKRPKLKAYTVEYGYKEGGKFIVLDSDYYKTDGYEDFKVANRDSLPLKMSISSLSTVE